MNWVYSRILPKSHKVPFMSSADRAYLADADLTE